MAISPPGLNHIRAQDSLDQLRACLGQEQFEQARAEALALSSHEALNLASGEPVLTKCDQPKTSQASQSCGSRAVAAASGHDAGS